MGATIADTFDRSLELSHIALLLQQRARMLRRRDRREIRGASDGATSEERLSAVVKAAHPESYCFTCLGIALELPERKVREAAQLLILADGFGLQHYKCFHCGRADQTIIMAGEI